MIAHVFSNAGFLFSGTCLAREAEEEEEEEEEERRRGPPLLLLRSRLRGAIFDSCPARVDEDLALRGISAAARGVPAASRATEAEMAGGGCSSSSPSSASAASASPSSSSSSSSPHSILSPPSPPPQSSSLPSLRDSALRLALRAFLRSGPVEKAMDAAWRAWEGGGKSGGGGENDAASVSSSPPPPSCPRIYAYSLTDTLIPPESVEEVATAALARAEELEKQKEKEEKSGGGKTSSSSSSSSSSLPAVSLRVFDSPHCEHLRWHPQEYLKMMEDFASAIEKQEEEMEREEEDAMLHL